MASYVSFGNHIPESMVNFAPIPQLGMLYLGIFVIQAEFAYRILPLPADLILCVQSLPVIQSHFHQCENIY